MYKYTQQKLAIEFHNKYEELAPKYGYETRKDTKVLDLNSPNGKLMLAVMDAVMIPKLEEAYRQGAEEKDKVKESELKFIASDELYGYWYECPRCNKSDIVEKFSFCPHCGVEIVHDTQEQGGKE